LAKDPNNAACKDGLEETRKFLTQQMPNDENMGERMRNVWGNARNLVQTNPNLKQYKDDPSFLAMISVVYF
jgi:hypothetical protein